MTQIITERDIDDIARGAGILGGGGGGDPYIGGLLAKHALANSGPVTIVPLADVPDDALVLPVAIMGAPTVIVEKPPSGTEFDQAFDLVAGSMERPATHVGCFEVGGLNSMTPIVTAARHGLPLVDGDGMGRAFPELQMATFNLDGVSVSPLAVADEKGNTMLLQTVDGPWAERLARTATVEMGCSASVVLYPHTGAQTRKTMIPGTITLARDIGSLVRRARDAHEDPAETLTEYTGGAVLMRGKVTDVIRSTEAGFSKGYAMVDGLGPDADMEMRIDFQNEYLVARCDNEVLATVPDIITILDTDTGEPVLGEALRYGYRVTVVALPCHDRWTADDALKLIGPQYFGYDINYSPIKKADPHVVLCPEDVTDPAAPATGACPHTSAHGRRPSSAATALPSPPPVSNIP